jgi:hypothetical protein
LWITFFLQRSFSLESGVQKLHLLPVAVMVVDFLENVAIMIMLAAYPTQLTAVAQAATLFTALKWLLFAATVAATLFALIMWGIRRFIPVGSIAH